MNAQKKTTPKREEILAVEDSPTQAESLRYLLDQHGYHVTVAKDGKQALALLDEHIPALIISDITMPEMNGYELCKIVKADETLRDIPVILLTSLTNPEDVLEGLACGADSFITKPYSADYLLAYIQQMLAGWNLRKNDRVRVGVEILFAGKRRFISADQQQMLGLLLSTYEAAVQRNNELLETQEELHSLNEQLEDKVKDRTAALLAENGERKRAEEDVRKRLNELEMLYSASQEIGKLIQPKEIGQNVIDILSERLQWHHATLRLYHPENETIELLAFQQPSLENDAERLEAEERYKRMVVKLGQGLVGWVIQHGQSVYCGDVTKDPRYIEASPGIRSGMYVPLKVGERASGCLSVESEQANAFTETDEWLITTLAAQAASALENARLFAETRQRLAESEAVNKISIALRTAVSLDTMLHAFLDETLALLGTPAGAIWLHDAENEELYQTASRGWFTNIQKSTMKSGEGLVGITFATGESQIVREFIRESLVLDANLRQIAADWGGICVPILSAEAIVGVLLISVQLPRELAAHEIRVLNLLAEILGIAIQRMRLHEQTKRQLEHVRVLHEIDTVIASSFDLSFTLDIFLKNLLTQLQVDAASILLPNLGSRTFDYAAGKGFLGQGMAKFHPGTSDGNVGRVVRERKLIVCSDLHAEPSSPIYNKLVADEGFIFYCGIPLIAKGEINGVLEIFNRAPLIPNREWMSFISALAGQVANAIDSSLTYNNLQRSNMDLMMAYDTTLEGWSRALDMRDKETEGHSVRVTEMTTQLAHVLGIKGVDAEHMRRGALLHDIGKMGVPDAILLKPGPLTEQEWEVMRTHPTRAYELLLPISYLRQALEIPYCHHEKWDGSGYPRGMKGENIPLAARIFAVVDVWDALRSDRPYRLAWPEEKALEHIREQSGKHFDPKVAEAFLRLIPDMK